MILDGIYPARGRAFIRRVETRESYTGSGIIIPPQARDRVARQQFIVVSVGDYERCADPEECNRPHWRGVFHKHRLNVGDWVLVRNRAHMATPDPDVYVVWQADILGVFQEKP